MMGYEGMMGGWGGGLVFGSLFQIELVVIGALLIAWLWKQVNK
ncbi:MAG TPA: hypothetical protein VD862_04590 [Candidatus Paceibacterota bacterium]|nr:hypothetical protein [Candidatus Paceibacterota bacterium]